MTIFYLDLEGGGNDNYAGTSFNLLASGTNGRTAGTSFTSATASFPNDGSLIGQYLSIFNGSTYGRYSITAWVSPTSLSIAQIPGGISLITNTIDRQYYIGGRVNTSQGGLSSIVTQPGDTIRIMGSPAPTSLGVNGTWTSSIAQVGKSINTVSNSTPISISVTSHGYSTGDTVMIAGVSGNTSANGVWEITVTGENTFTLDGSVNNGTGAGGGTVFLKNNCRIKLASALTQNIASTGQGRSPWTGVSGTSPTFSTATKEGYQADIISISDVFTTGLAAYYPTGTLDLSSYQQVSFWIKQNTGTLVTNGQLELRLCSDTAGAVTVNTIPIPSIPNSIQWMPVTVDLGTNLGSSIQSIALYVITDSGAQNLFLSNIIACKASSAANSLTLTSLIGKNVTGETWWGIQSINGNRVMLDLDTNCSPLATTSPLMRGYYGTTETVTTWKRETIKLGPFTSSGSASIGIPESGVDGSPITYSGGWDRTNMSTQNLETWFDGVNGYGTAIVSSKNYVNFEKIAGTRFLQFITDSTGLNNYSIIAANNCTGSSASGAIDCRGSFSKYTIDFICANIYGFNASSCDTDVTIVYGILSSGTTGLTFNVSEKSKFNAFSSSTRIANNFRGVSMGDGRAQINNLYFIDNTTDVDHQTVNSGSRIHTALNCFFASATEVSQSTSVRASYFYSQNHDQTINNHKVFDANSLIFSAVDQRHTASGISWKFQPVSTSRTASWPLSLSLAKVACAANSLVTVKAWMRRDNTGLTMRLVCKGGQIAGVAADVTSSMTAAADTWEELTITFTPTEIGVVEITAEAYGGTTYSGWVDDLTVSQA